MNNYQGDKPLTCTSVFSKVSFIENVKHYHGDHDILSLTTTDYYYL
jgi:hypothetical protein